MHLTDTDIVTLISGRTVGGTAREHAMSCGECGARLHSVRALDALSGKALRLLDHPLRPVDVDLITGSVSRKTSLLPARIAAGGVLLLAAAGVAAAVPASPLHTILAGVVSRLRTPKKAPATVVPRSARAPLATPAQAARGNAALSFLPDRSLSVVFMPPNAVGRVRIVLADVAEVSLRTSGKGIAADLGNDQVVVTTAFPGEAFLITLPSTLTSVVIRAGHDTLFRRLGARVTTSGIMEAAGAFDVSFPKRSSSPPNHYVR